MHVNNRKCQYVFLSYQNIKVFSPSNGYRSNQNMRLLFSWWISFWTICWFWYKTLPSLSTSKFFRHRILGSELWFYQQKTDKYEVFLVILSWLADFVIFLLYWSLCFIITILEIYCRAGRKEMQKNSSILSYYSYFSRPYLSNTFPHNFIQTSDCSKMLHVQYRP